MRKITLFLTCALSCGITSSMAQYWQYVGPTDIAKGNSSPSIVIDKYGTPYVLSDSTVFKYSSGSWAPVGGARAFNVYAGNDNIALDTNGIPYVFYASGPSYRGFVVKFNGTTWDTVGSGSLPDSICCTNSLAIGPNNTPYIAFPGSASDSGKLTVMKFDGSNWVTVGTPPPLCEPENMFLAIGPGNVPYVAFVAVADSYKVKVMTYNGSAWEYVGTTGIMGSFREGGWPFIILDKSGTPYLSYTAGGGFGVGYFDGSNWQHIGDFAGEGWGYTTMAMNTAGTLFAAFKDLTISAAVLKYRGGSDWSYVGCCDISARFAAAPSIAVNPVTGIPYVAFLGSMGYDSLNVVEPGVWAGVNNVGSVQPALDIYPNPSAGAFTLKISSPNNENTTVTVTDIFGAVVAKYLLPTNTGDDIQLRVASGMYFLSVNSDDIKLNTKLIIN